MGSSSERSSAPEGQLISRRTLVRAGATAAWAVPAIQLVGAAPAFAGSNSLQVSVTTAVAGGTKVRVTGTVKNPMATTSLGTVTLVFTLPQNPTSSSQTGGDFAGSGTTYTVSSLGPGITKSFDVTFVVSSTPSGSVTASATAQNATPGSGSLPITAQTLSVVSSSGAANSSPAAATWSQGQMRLSCSAAVYNPGPSSATSVQLEVSVSRAASSSSLGNGNTNGWSANGSSADKKTWYFTWTGTLAPNTSTLSVAPRITFDTASPQPTASYRVTWAFV